MCSASHCSAEVSSLLCKLPFLTLLAVFFLRFCYPYLLQFCPSVLSFVFNELFKPPFDVLSDYFYEASLKPYQGEIEATLQ